MTVTLNEMATAYITSIESQLVSAKEQLTQAEHYVQQLEEHLDECKLVNSNEAKTKEVLGKSMPSQIDVDLNNPFANNTTN